jgi:hypothetical protein
MYEYCLTCNLQTAGIWGRNMRCSEIPRNALFTPSKAKDLSVWLSIAVAAVLGIAVLTQMAASIMWSCGYSISKVMHGNSGPMMLIDQIQFLTVSPKILFGSVVSDVVAKACAHGNVRAQVLGNLGGFGQPPETVRIFSQGFAWSIYNFPGIVDIVMLGSDSELGESCPAWIGNEMLERIIIIAVVVTFVALCRYAASNLIRTWCGKYDGFKRLRYPKWEGMWVRSSPPCLQHMWLIMHAVIAVLLHVLRLS